MTDPPQRPKRVLLIGWDAADWKIIDPLLDAGQMPNLRRFIDEGTSGNVATLQPALSPMLWTSIATGKLADKHGILGFAEPDRSTGKPTPVTSTSRRCKALWNILSDRGRPAGAINWYASHPAEHINGFVVTDRFAHPVGPLKPDEPMLGWPAVPRSVWPQEDLDPLAAVRVHPAMINRDMVVEFIPSAGEPECALWPKVAELRMLLAHSTTIHNAATAYIAEREWDFMGVYYDAIDRFAHAFMEFHPPKMDHISDEDFDRYSGVMNACYRLHDLMLGRLMKLVDDDTLVVLLSDHGFHSDHLRPKGTSGIKDGQPVAWHRHYGVIAFHGPGVKQGDKLYGATLLDVTPTILDALGLPIAHDMDGQPLRQIWQHPGQPPERIQTYETEGEPRAAHDPEDADVAEKMLEQLRQLGYLSHEDDDGEGVQIDRARNLGIVYLSTGRPAQAVERFKWILERKPEDKGTRMSMLSALLALERYDDCEKIAQGLLEEGAERPRIELIRAMIASRQGRDDDALERLRDVERMDPQHPGLQCHLGQAFLKRDLLEDAEQRFLRALEIDPDDAAALDGLGVAYRRTGRAPEAVLAHVRAIALEHHRPGAHLNLARALVDAGRLGWALEAIGVALRMMPTLAEAHELAAELCEHRLDKPRRAAFHRERLEQIHKLREQARASRDQSIASFEALSDRVTAIPAFHAQPVADASLPITIVTGLPRSGTSLMMQILAAAGIEPLTDHEREPDEDNPRGYLELEAVKHTARDASWLTLAPGRAVKMVHTLLRTLPPGRDYRVVFMRRDLDEIIASQRKMLERLNRPGGGLDDTALRDAFQRDLDRTLDWTKSRADISLIEINYNDLMRDPGPSAARLSAFLQRDIDPSALLAALDPTLYRNRRP